MVLPFDGVSAKWYAELFAHPDFWHAAANSTIIALAATVLSTLLGTAGALVWARDRFPLKHIFQGLAVAPLLFPQLILGFILLMWFSVLGNWFDFSMNIYTVIVGHVVYIVPFTLIVVLVQLATFDDTLEDAARDCGATEWQVYREVTLPLIWPGIFAAAIFAFLISWGNFYLTYSLGGTTRALPTFLFTGLSMSMKPLYAAVASVIFVPGLLLVIVAEWLRRRGRLPQAERTPRTAPATQ
jgi:spermidine/putrescine transport system permease protein